MFADSDSIHSWRLLLVLLLSIFGTQALAMEDELQLENELLLELRLNGEKLGLDVLGYQRGDDFLLSLDELTNGLGFPITVNGDTGFASGWYISEDRAFSLDITLAEVISNGKIWSLVDGEAVIFQGGLYVETEALQKWFPLRLSAVVRELYLDVEPTELLPIQQRFKRRERAINHSSDNKEPQHALQHTPYQFFGPHITNLRMAYSTSRQTPESDAEYRANYASLSRGDLGWMTSTLSLVGQSNESVTGARLKLERTAFEGPLGINHFELGDVDAGGFRGLMLRGGGAHRAGGGRFDNESVNLEGSQLPDWDVELYQNDQLIMIQTTGPDGRYLFEDVPLQFGENRFELKFFGPNGEIDSREEYQFLGVGMLEPGRVSYEVSAVQSGRTVFGLNDVDGAGDRDSGIYSSNFNLGVSHNLTLGIGISSQKMNGNRLDSNNIGFGLSTSRLYGSVRYFNAPSAQNSVNTSLRTRLGSTSLNLAYTKFFDEPSLASSPQKWKTSVGISSSILSIPIKVEINTQEQETNTAHDAVIGTTTSLLGSGQLSSSLWYSSFEDRTSDVTTKTSQAGGQSSLHTSIRPWTFRLSASYKLEPESEILDFSADSSLHIDKGLKLDLSVKHDPTVDATYYGGGINWQLDQVAINARVSYDSNERWGGLITLSTALVHQPDMLRPRFDSRASADAGSVEARVFEDFDGGKGQPQSGVDVKAVQVWRNASTDKHGVAYLSRLPAHQQVDVELDFSTLSEIELRSTNPGISIIPRPGSYAVIDFPIVRTAELEGHVVVADNDNEKPVSRALVWLKTLDGEVVSQTRTAFDGFFLFDGIEPGEYLVSLDDTLAERLLDQPGSVTVLGNSSVIRELDFTLRSTRAKRIRLNRVAQNENEQQQPISEASYSIPPLLARAMPDEDTHVMPKKEIGKWYVQLGAYGSRRLALAFWNRISKDKQLFQGKTPRFSQYQNMTRLLVNPGLSREAANELCQQLKEDKMDCLVRNIE